LLTTAIAIPTASVNITVVRFLMPAGSLPSRVPYRCHRWQLLT
jgi:hypothetical protein